jgi:hypothetical protein
MSRREAVTSFVLRFFWHRSSSGHRYLRTVEHRTPDSASLGFASAVQVPCTIVYCAYGTYAFPLVRVRVGTHPVDKVGRLTLRHTSDRTLIGRIDSRHDVPLIGAKMPVSQVTALLEFSGTVAGGGIWNTGLWTTTDTFPADPVAGVQSVATDAADAILQLWGTGLSDLNTSDTLLLAASCRLYAAGATASTAYAQVGVTGTPAGTGTQSGAASQACVITLQSPLAGRSGRGRMYMPATGSLGANTEQHRFKAATLDLLMPGLVTFFLAVEAMSLDDSHALFPVVRSLKMSTVHQFNRFKVDARPDRQEHRERGLVFPSRNGSFA